jgi:hypothetical protein
VVEHLPSCSKAFWFIMANGCQKMGQALGGVCGVLASMTTLLEVDIEEKSSNMLFNGVIARSSSS